MNTVTAKRPMHDAASLSDLGPRQPAFWRAVVLAIGDLGHACQRVPLLCSLLGLFKHESA